MTMTTEAVPKTRVQKWHDFAGNAAVARFTSDGERHTISTALVYIGFEPSAGALMIGSKVTYRRTRKRASGWIADNRRLYFRLSDHWRRKVLLMQDGATGEADQVFAYLQHHATPDTHPTSLAFQPYITFSKCGRWGIVDQKIAEVNP